jgi:CheY-like chemotaxis protein
MRRQCDCRNPTVLVVDDDHQIRMTLAELLSEEGYTVATASDGKRALAYLREQHACFVLLDLMMPTMSGWQALAELIDNPKMPRVPVGVISALVTETPLGTVGVLHKPLDLDRLLSLVHEHAGMPHSH